jgi:hypothetical protein
MHERSDDVTTDRDARNDEATKDAGVVSRRVVARGAAVGGLAMLFTAIGAGRVLAKHDDQDEDTDTQGEDANDQGEDDNEQGEDNDDQGEEVSAASAPMAGGCSAG